MVDRPRPGQPEDDASHEAALRMLVDALTGPGTPQELAREHAYLESFRAHSASATAAAARRRRRMRLGAAGGVAALALTGTAAALTGTYPGAGPTPSTSSVPASPTTSAHPRTTMPEPSSGRPTDAPVAPTTGGGTGSTAG